MQRIAHYRKAHEFVKELPWFKADTDGYRIYFALGNSIGLFLFQCQTDHAIGLICHEKGNIEHIIIQFQII